MSSRAKGRPLNLQGGSLTTGEGRVKVSQRRRRRFAATNTHGGGKEKRLSGAKKKEKKRLGAVIDPGENALIITMRKKEKEKK